MNFGQSHPNSEFTAVIRPGTPGFDDLSGLEGKEMEVEGIIELHKGRPQIVLTSPDKIRPAGEASAVIGAAAPQVPEKGRAG